MLRHSECTVVIPGVGSALGTRPGSLLTWYIRFGRHVLKVKILGLTSDLENNNTNVVSRKRLIVRMNNQDYDAAGGVEQCAVL